MKVLNRNTFTEEKVVIEKVKKGDNKSVDLPNGALNDFTLIYIGKSCYSLTDLEKIVNKAKTKDFYESLNYRVTSDSRDDG